MSEFKHPTSNEIATVNELAWIPCFLFGPFYLGVQGNAGQAVLWLILGVCTFGISWFFILPFFVKGILEKEYIKHGWSRVISTDTPQLPNVDVGKTENRLDKLFKEYNSKEQNKA